TVGTNSENYSLPPSLGGNPSLELRAEVFYVFMQQKEREKEGRGQCHSVHR
ncbi:hypothetical protein Tco_0504646, partial [Tanacetum coccineum]